MRALLSVVVVTSLFAVGCQSDEHPLETRLTGLKSPPSVRETWRLPYGSEAGELGLRRPSIESRAWGPQAATLTASGKLVVLDNEKGRVVTFDSRGELVGESPLSPLTVDMACSATLCWFLELATPSLLERVGVHGMQRKASKLSAAFKTAIGLGVVGSGPILYTAHQESYRPLAPQPLASRRSGLTQGGGRALSLSLHKDSRTIALHEEIEPLLEGSARRTMELFRSPTECDAARLIGSIPGNRLVTLCDVLENGVVERAVLVLDSVGTVQHSLPLSSESLYVPFRQVRLEGGKLLLLEALTDYLQVTLISFDGTGGEHE